MKHLDFQALADFNLVASHGGFGKASRASGKPKASLSRHVTDLEDNLGVRLLERVGRSFRLTDEGKSLQSRTAGLLDEITESALELTMGRAHPQGKLRISTPVTFGQAAIGSVAAQFIRQYPDVQLEVTVEDRMVDLIEGGYDAVIRVNPQPDNDLVGRPFYRDRLLVVAAPGLPFPALPFPALPENADTLASVPAIVKVGAAERSTWTVRQDAETHTQTHTFARHAVLYLPTPGIIRDAALGGAGAAIIAENLVKEDIQAGRLVCWGEVPNQTVEIWIMHSSRRLVSSKVAAFVAFLCDAFASQSLELKPPHRNP